MSVSPPERGQYGKILWTAFHDDVIRHVYRPDRTLGEVVALEREWNVANGQVARRAKEIGIHVKQFDYRMTDSQREKIRHVYETRKRSGNKILALEFGVAPRVISREAAKMGLPSLMATTRKKERPWHNDIELRIVRNNVHETIARIRQVLANKGYQRTYSQISGIIARKRASGEWPAFDEAMEGADLLSVAQICAGLGTNEMMVGRWIRAGLLRARNGPRTRWLITRQSMRAFLLDYRAHWRPCFRFADPDFLLDLLDNSTKPISDAASAGSL